MTDNTQKPLTDNRSQATESDELIWGAAAIGRVIGRSARQVFHLTETKAIPVQHVGGRLCARRSKLLAIAG